MKASSSHILLFFTLLTLKVICNARRNSVDVDSRTYRFNEQERPCNYRRQQGVCRRRSDCKKRTGIVCTHGLNPVVCCLDEPQRIAAIVSVTTTTPPVTTIQAIVRSNSIKEIDLTYPGCGLRLPKIQENNRNNNRPNNNGGSLSNGRGRGRGRGRISRTGKRSAPFVEGISDLFTFRTRRSVQHVIVGGVNAAPSSWPWMVAIFKETNARMPKRFLCGASLISQKYVLTAAHCFDGERGNIDPSKFFITVGAHTTKDGIEYPVQSILIHPDYKQGQYYNDISIIRLAKDVTLTQKVYPVCLPSDGLRHKINPDNKNVTVTGWGDTSFGGVSSKVLQELTIPIVPLKKCNSSYSKLALRNFPQGITNLFICAGVEEGGKDACQGDSGGPLVTKLKDESWVQLGIVSFGYGCAQAGYPGVYTRVSQFTEWIYDNTDLGKV